MSSMHCSRKSDASMSLASSLAGSTYQSVFLAIILIAKIRELTTGSL